MATAFGSETEKAKPLLNLLGLLTANNIYHLQVSKFMHSWHNGCLPEVFDDIFQYASNIHCNNTRYTAKKKNFYKLSIPTNVGKQSISFMAIDIWQDLPSESAFPKKIICFLLFFVLLMKQHSSCKYKFFLLYFVFLFFSLYSFDFTRYLKPKLFRELTRKPTGSFSFLACTLFSLHLVYLAISLTSLGLVNRNLFKII